MTPNELAERKDQHLDIVLERDARVFPEQSPFDRLQLEHEALPETDLQSIDLGTRFLGHALRAPLLISSMTGGPQRAADINRHLAEAAQELGIAMGVGSQRIALQHSGDQGLTRELRRLAPDILLLGNLGAAQILGDSGPDLARRAVEQLQADALFIHLNPLQEAIQPEGDHDWRGVLAAIERLVPVLPCPLVIKEVGYGIGPQTARRLLEVGVAAIDVAGRGGTRWAAIEGRRSPDPQRQQLADAFRDWGWPTPELVQRLRQSFPDLPLIASGGIRHGVDAAKALHLGADLAGQAAAVLPAAMQSTEAVVAHFQTLIQQLRIACLCTGSASLAELRQAGHRWSAP